MHFDLKTLRLNDVYDFEGTVESGQNKFLAKLHLSPDKITMTVLGEVHEDRKPDWGYDNIEKLFFRDLNKTFILHSLVQISGYSRVISLFPKSLWFFEYTFEVDYVVYSPSQPSHGASINSISLHSNKINEWIGNTETQEKIIHSYSKLNKPFSSFDNLAEFEHKIEEIGSIGVWYNLSMHFSSPTFSAGINFPPTLTLLLKNNEQTEHVMHSFLKLYSLLVFFIGDDFHIDEVNVTFCPDRSSDTGSIYYASSKSRPKYDHGYSLFPLGKNLRFDTLGLPSLPLATFNNYYSLPESICGYFFKYLKYKRMENSEERFLGYFRILESLCYKKKSYLDDELIRQLCTRIKPYLVKKFDDQKNVKNFLKGIPKLNNSKYNTEKCLQDFFMELPRDISESWKIQKQDIGKICKLRNDITHANNHDISETKLVEYVKFIEVLLIYSLYEKLGVEIPVAAIVLHRIHGYHLIAK